MKYAETCECGVVLEVTSDDPMMFARVKGRWKLDHEGHSLGRLRAKRKKVVVEIDLLNQLITELTLKAEDAEKRLALITPITPPASRNDMVEVAKQLHDMSPENAPSFKIKSVQQAAAMGVISKKSALERNFGDWEKKGFPPGDQSDAVMAAWHEAIKGKITRGDENSEQGKQVQGKGDEGAASSKRTFARSWTQRHRLGRGGGQRQR